MNAVNDLPVLSDISNVTLDEDGDYSFAISYSDIDNDLFVSSGYFPLKAGQTERIAMAISLGNDQADALRNRNIAQTAYESDYQFAKSPTTALETTKQSAENEFLKNRSVILTELTSLYEKSGTSEKPDIWVISGAMNIVAKIMELVENCRSEVLIAIPQAGEEIVKQALPKLRQLNEKGVKITILTSDKLDKESVKAISRIAKIKIKSGLFGGGIISDKRYVVILMGPEISGSKTTDIVAIWADHAGLAGFAKEYFEYLLKDAKEVK